MEGDVRKKYVLASTCNFFEMKICDNVFSATTDEKNLMNFLDDPNVKILTCCTTIDKKINFTNILPSSIENSKKTIIFFKLKNESITPENMQSSILISSMFNSPLSSFYHALKMVFAPLLTNSKTKLEPNLEQLVADLQNGIGASLSIDNDAVITIQDELDYWIQVRNGNDSQAELVNDIFQPIEKDFRDFQSLEFDQVIDLLDECLDVFDDLWKTVKPPYPEIRMKKLLLLVASSIIKLVNDKLSDLDIWNEKESLIRLQLKKSNGICEAWIKTCNTLQEQFWNKYSTRPWKGDKFIPNGLVALKDRLEEIIDIRSTHKYLNEFLTNNKENLFTPFYGLNAVHYNSYTEPLWRKAVEQFNRLLEPVLVKFVGNLKKEIEQFDATNTTLILKEFEKYKSLVKRENVKKIMSIERESLLGKLHVLLKEVKQEFTNFQIPSINQPLVVSKIIWASNLETKFERIEQTDWLLNDLKGFEKLKRTTIEGRLECVNWRKKIFDEWCRNLSQLIDDKDSQVSLETTGRAISINHMDGKLEVNYAARLVALLREVRCLNNFGYSIPAKVEATAKTARKYYKFAIVLKQVAHFYNTIDDEMLKFQQPIMLDSALAFEKLIKTAKIKSTSNDMQVTWDQPDQLRAYIDKLQAACEKLIGENRRLRKHHYLILDKISSLIDIDLLKQQQKWKDILLEIRQIFATLALQGYSQSNMKSWKAHLDRQLYKVLECQYLIGLEKIDENLPEIRVDLIVKNNQVEFKPSFEEIKAKYYKEIKKFLSIPNYFKGFGDEPKLFATIIDRSAVKLYSTFSKANIIFTKLIKIIEEFQEWTVFGNIDIDEFLELNLKSLEDYQLNFKALKLKGRSCEKLANELKVSCITINCIPIKTAIDEYIQLIFDSIVQTLKRSVVKNGDEIEKFLIDGMESLANRPQTVEEIGLANGTRLKLVSEKLSVSEKMREAEKRNNLLKQIVGYGVDNLNNQQGKWDKFELMVESHQLMISDQMTVLKCNMVSRIDDFNSHLDKFASRWNQFKPNADTFEGGDEKCLEALNFIREKRVEFDELLECKKIIERDCQHFDMEIPEFTLASSIHMDMKEVEETWKLYDKFTESVQILAKEDWISFRSKYFQFDELLTSWNDQLKSDEPTWMMLRLQRKVDQYKLVVPQLKWVRGESLTAEHWIELFQLLQMPKSITIEKLTFADIIKSTNAIIEKSDKLKELNLRAQGEVTIREALRELDLWAAGANFALCEYEDTAKRKINLIKDWKDILTVVGDNQCLLQSLKDSPYYKTFQDKASIWESRLASLDEYLHNLNQIQRKWVYLEPIFSRGALPKEQDRFKSVDNDFRNLLNDIEKDCRIVSLTDRKTLSQLLTQDLQQLQRCEKALNELLEEKRALFPRFYFIGDDDMLEILGQSTNPQVIQAHLKKLFSGIYSVEFDKKSIVAMKSIEGEVVILDKPVEIVDAVEVWLSQLAERMKSTLELLLVECLKDSNTNGIDPLKYPSQILCLAEFIRFTTSCQKAISGGQLKTFHQTISKQLESYTNVDIGNDENAHVLDLKLKALILDCIHNIDVIDQLMEFGTTSIDEWQWQKQLRYYMNKETCIMKMVDAQFDYTYEYQGNAGKLVHTPLTDKCYLTLTQAMSMGMGGNPYGPAGTGKTESVKALGGLFGRQVLVFNCDEAIDVQSMGRIFIGLVKCGAWGCFDEFNRLEEAVLSAVSMQIQSIQDAIKIKARQAEIMGKTINIDHNAGIFITMNPAGKGYGGRSKLPDNLKQLFRPVAMSKPDNDLIAEVTLFSEGYKRAKSLGRKIVAVFNLSKELLTPQQHYDWGLRSLKTILRGCGALLHKAKENGGGSVDAKQEASLCVQALRINTLSKLTFSDGKRFEKLLNDVIPGVTFKGIEYKELSEAIEKTCLEIKLEKNDIQIKKCLELYDNLSQRMGVVVVGPSGSGKSTLWKLLQSSLHKLGTIVKRYVMNPKAMPRQMLLGNIDMDTREWSDGVLTWASRQVIKEPNEIRSWIICDGDIDPEWIESLNSVLDDNRLLTMPSGERIQFAPNANFLFECHDLSYASPATVSRMGMIFISDEDTSIKDVVEFWLKKQDCQNDLRSWIDELYFKAFDFVLKYKSQMIVGLSLVGIALNGLSHLHYAKCKPEFAIGLVKGFGANLPFDIRELLTKEILSWIGQTIPDSNRILDTFYDVELNRLSLHTESNMDSDSELIYTSDVKRYLSFIQPWLDSKQPFILVGPEGCGKSLLLKACFEKLKNAQIATLFCSAQTGPEHLIQKLNALCNTTTTNTGKTMKSKEGDKIVLYLKDLNLPKPDKYGSCMLISFLQNLLLYNGFYDENLEFVALENVILVATMNVSGMGRHPITTRFTSIVRILSIGYPDKEQLESIYGKKLRNLFSRKKSNWTDDKISTLACDIVEIYTLLNENFTTDDYGHYSFNLRHLTEWVGGFTRYDFNSTNILEICCYEAMRLFRDRIVGNDKLKFDTFLSKTFKRNWDGRFFDEIYDKYFLTFGACVEGQGVGKPIPSNGMTLGELKEDMFAEIINKALMTYARDQCDMQLVLFQQVYETISRIERVLTMPGGSLLLAGRSGVGRRSSLTLVAHMHMMKIFTPKISRVYGMKQFKIDLKNVMQQTGIDGEQVIFLIEDHQLVNDSFLEMINSILAAGEVPGLYTPEEIEPLVGCLREKAIDQDYRGTLPSFFASMVKINLHIVLIMDSSNVTFSAKLQSNPAILKECTVLWMDSWPEQSMKTLPHLILTEPSHESSIPTQEQRNISNQRRLSGGDELLNGFYELYKSCSNLDPTPRKYLAFIYMYSNLYGENKVNIELKIGHLQAGISKMNEAKDLVDTLKKEAAQQSVILAEKQEEADKALKEITKTMENAGDQKIEMEKLQIVIEKETDNITKRKVGIDAELAEVEPILKEAKEAVGCIKPESLNEIRALKSPPEVIRNILEGALKLMGIQDTSWNSMKVFLGKRGVTQDIVQFDARKVSKKNRKAVEDLLVKNEKSFDAVNAKKASQAAAPLACWVKAQIKFANVIENIEPLENEQAKLQSNLKKIEDKAAKLRNALQQVDEKVAGLKLKFEKMTGEAMRLKIQLDKAEETILAAESLVGKLEGEYSRWSGQVGQLKNELKYLPLRSLISAAFVIYLPNASEDKRSEKVKEWKELLKVDDDFQVDKFLSTESQQLSWKAEGLPTDNLSMENAMLMLKINKMPPGKGLRPFLIDPSSRATEWLKVHMKNNRMECVNQQDPSFNTVLELAVRFGKTLIITEVDGVEPILYPILRGDLIQQGPRFVVEIGEKQIDYNEEFRLFLTTRNPSPQLTPDAEAIITIVNFTTTRAGLTGQLLAATIQNEKPDLEMKKTDLLKNEEELKIQLSELESSLLQQLANASGNILENKQLIESLNQTKQSSMTITNSLDESKKLQSFLDNERSAYLPLAEFASRMFFTISDLNKINNMYRFSLNSFMVLFNRTLSTKDDGLGAENRIGKLKISLQNLVYDYVSRSLFKADRLMFALHLSHGMYNELFGENEWEFFNNSLIIDMKINTELPSWIEKDRFTSVSSFNNVFPQLFSNLKLTDSATWSKFCRSTQCENDLPNHVLKNYTIFQHLLIVQAIRPDRLQSAMSTFARKALNRTELSPPNVNLRKLYEEETSAELPVLVIISTGADPSQDLEELAKEIVGDKYFQVAMGQGQAEIAIKLLNECAKEGYWLCLKNLHLVCSWLTNLEKSFKLLKPHPNFRLWFTAESHMKFPPILLQSTLKLTYEAPPGVKKNILRSYESWTPQFIASGGNTERSQSFFVLSWFHSVLSERRNYIPQGWTKAYEFNFSDLRAATIIIDRLFQRISNTKNVQVPWNFIHGLFENAIYGGRVDNLFDQRVLTCFLNEYFNSNQINSESKNKKLGPMRMISSTNHKDFLEEIEKLSEFDKPTFFGLPENIERAAQQTTANCVINQLRALKRSTASSNKFDRQLWAKDLGSVLNLWKKLNEGGGNLLKLKSEIPVQEDESPIKAFIILENYNAISLVHYIHKSLSNLSKLLKGTCLLTNQLSNLANDLMSNQTPISWQSKWEGSEDVKIYLQSVIYRAKSITTNWLDMLDGDEIFNRPLDLSQLFRPDVFLNAFKQMTARFEKISMDNLKLSASWTNNNDGGGGLSNKRNNANKKSLQLKINGLRIEGCNFDGKRMLEKQAHSSCLTDVPNFLLGWIDNSEPDVYEKDCSILVPVYFNCEREKLVCQVRMPCTNQNFWIQCGVAMFLKE